VLLQVHTAAFGADHAPTLVASCGTAPGIACRLVWNLTHSARAAELTNTFLAAPVHLLLRVVFVVVLALAVRALAHRVINRLTERATESILPQFKGGVATSRLVPGRLLPRRLRDRDSAKAASSAPAAPAAPAGPATMARGGARAGDAASQSEFAAVAERALIDERRKQRVRALGSILRSAASVTIFTIAGVAVLGELGINLAPLLASAGVVGIAVGFGAQNMVRDYLSGIFMLLEDQYGVGDVITVGDETGTVEGVSLRVTRMRDVNGIVWHIRNGMIEQVGNESQGWARAVIDFPVPYQANLSAIRMLLSDTAESLWKEPYWRTVMIEQPEVWGAQQVTSAVVTMRIVVKTAPLRQWEVEREMRARVKASLDTAGIVPAA
jgi:moderate conductance mechanosensitive channel